jgi:nicotinic acid mononucleotide adenylyltransferase
MALLAANEECRSCLHDIAAIVDSQLSGIHELTRSGQIQPSQRLALAEDQGQVSSVERTPRVGVYPLAANPMHWGHILVGLAAIALMKLDKVVFVIAGRDERKPSMTAAETRHLLGKSALEDFSPIFEYSPIALGTSSDGETSFGRILSLNSHQRMEAYYIAGMDHCRRLNSAGEPDTIEKLERVIKEQKRAGNRNHAISLIFVERGGIVRESESVRTFLDVHLLPPLPFALSSTAVRRALCSGASLCDAFVSLPCACLLAMRPVGPFTGVRECFEGTEVTRQTNAPGTA